jgi:hypothetical protein
MIVWWPWMLRQFEVIADAAGQSGGLLDASPGHLTHTIRWLAIAPLRLLFEPRSSVTIAPWFAVTIYLLPWLLVRRHTGMLLWALWMTIPVGLTCTLDLLHSARHLEQLRHFSIAGPAVCAILAGAMAGGRRILAHGIPALVAVACAAALPLTYTRQNPRYSDIGKALSDPATANEPVVFYSDVRLPFWAELMYLGAAHYSGTFPRSAALIHRPVSPQLLAQLRQYQHIWLVWGGTSLSRDSIIPGTRSVFDRGDPHLGFVARLEWVDRIPSTP